MTRIRAWMVPSLLALLLVLPTAVSAQTSSGQPPLLLRHPALSQDKIAFRYADDIWTVSRQGGEAERLTSNGHVNSGPFYSPDGSIDRLLGCPARQQRCLPHPGRRRRSAAHHLAPSRQRGGRLVTRRQRSCSSRSRAASYRHYDRLFRVHADGSGVPEPLPLPSGVEGSFSPDGQSLAYQPCHKWQPAWKRYVGGQTTPIWIVNLKTLDLERCPARELQ